MIVEDISIKLLVGHFRNYLFQIFIAAWNHLFRRVLKESFINLNVELILVLTNSWFNVFVLFHINFAPTLLTNNLLFLGLNQAAWHIISCRTVFSILILVFKYCINPIGAIRFSLTETQLSFGALFIVGFIIFFRLGFSDLLFRSKYWLLEFRLFVWDWLREPYFFIKLYISNFVIYWDFAFKRAVWKFSFCFNTWINIKRRIT